jgi:ankyrin repeat protein
MAHQPGWIELYEILEADGKPSQELVDVCKTSRTGLGETMLHWYAIEGEPNVLEKLIDLGFSINVQNDFGRTPITECSLIGRWDNAQVLLDRGVDLSLTDEDGLNYFQVMDEYAVDLPEWIARLA